jgi:hypothetical protein
MRNLDLTRKAPASEPADPVDGVYANPEVAPDASAAESLTPRVATLRLRVRNPETGRVETIELESTVPGREARMRMAREALRLAGGAALQSLWPGDALYVTAMARILVQCSEIDKSQRWFLDEPMTVAAVAEALVEHDQRYFRGDGSPGGDDPGALVVAWPWTRHREPAAGAAS